MFSKRMAEFTKWKYALILALFLQLAGCSSGSSGDANDFIFGGVRWIAPSERVDGTTLSPSEIAGYRLHYGLESGFYTDKIFINDSAAVQAQLGSVPSGTYYIVVTTIDTDGRQSSYSSEVVLTL